MFSWGISCQILSNWHVSSSTSRAGWRALPIKLQTCSIVQRSVALAGQGSVQQTLRQAVETLCSVRGALPCWNASPGWWNMKGNTMGHRTLLMYLCAVKLWWMTTKRLSTMKCCLLWNEMATQTITPGCRLVCRKTVRLLSHCCPGLLQTCLRWSSLGLSSKWDSSLKAILLQSETFQCEWTRNYCKQAWCCIEVNGSGCRDLSSLSVSPLWMVLAVTEELLARTTDDNDASGIGSQNVKFCIFRWNLYAY